MSHAPMPEARQRDLTKATQEAVAEPVSAWRQRLAPVLVGGGNCLSSKVENQFLSCFHSCSCAWPPLPPT